MLNSKLTLYYDYSGGGHPSSEIQKYLDIHFAHPNADGRIRLFKDEIFNDSVTSIYAQFAGCNSVAANENLIAGLLAAAAGTTVLLVADEGYYTALPGVALKDYVEIVRDDSTPSYDLTAVEGLANKLANALAERRIVAVTENNRTCLIDEDGKTISLPSVGTVVGNSTVKLVAWFDQLSPEALEFLGEKVVAVLEAQKIGV